MRSHGHTQVEPKKEAEAMWSARARATAKGKVWLKCNNWYTKSGRRGAEATKDGVAADESRYYGMWFETHSQYLDEALRREGGPNELLTFQ